VLRVTRPPVTVRNACEADLEAIRGIYNEGIEDRVATLDLGAKPQEDILSWWRQHGGEYSILVATEAERVIGWASLNPFSHRCAHAEVADLSIYVARDCRGRGVGYDLLRRLTEVAKQNGFHKIVLHALDLNEPGKRLYRKAGFIEVGVFKEHGRLDGRFVDVVAMELLL
jgi:L-amino acid N-acyltransferase YncA